ncbi:MAG: hypothetical protein EON56_03855 [Alphaproteobacteria bacterium]|nr:MAG: hypothetical protein EON56_03855 [Alphaproteobacteria bacterium]
MLPPKTSKEREAHSKERTVAAGCVVLTVAYLTQFVSESYKRPPHGSAVAASIAAELGFI